MKPLGLELSIPLAEAAKATVAERKRDVSDEPWKRILGRGEPG